MDVVKFRKKSKGFLIIHFCSADGADDQGLPDASRQTEAGNSQPTRKGKDQGSARHQQCGGGLEKIGLINR